MAKVEILSFDDRPEEKVVNPEVLEKMLEDAAAKKKANEKIKAKYKIEVIFGPGRSISYLKPSKGRIITWLSGSALHGGGDELMYFCGNDECSRPIEPQYFVAASLLCPYCGVESFASQMDKEMHITALREAGQNTQDFRAMPVCYDGMGFNTTPPELGRRIERIWYKLGGNADIYLKYFEDDIRFTAAEAGRSMDERLGIARAKRKGTRGIYPLHRLIRDLNAGAEPWKRFASFVTA